MCKCQVHAGARGKAGGVAVVQSPAEAEAFAAKWLGSRLVTGQTGPEGKLVSRILIERATESVRELYVGATIDRTSSNLVIMASEAGGMSIEELAAKDSSKILKCNIDMLTGPQPYQGRALAYQLGLKGKQVNEFAKIFMGIARCFIEKDLSLVEINPLAVTTEGSLLCLDAKINLDSYALYRHPDLVELDDPSQEDPRIARAVASNFSYVPLNGTIGCLVNGARVMEAFKIILEDPNVKCILVNIFGGIVRCDLIAEGILGAVHDVGTKVPVVVRLEGNHAQDGARILHDSGLDITAAHGLREAALLAVQKASA